VSAESRPSSQSPGPSGMGVSLSGMDVRGGGSAMRKLAVEDHGVDAAPAPASTEASYIDLVSGSAIAATGNTPQRIHRFVAHTMPGNHPVCAMYSDDFPDDQMRVRSLVTKIEDPIQATFEMNGGLCNPTRPHEVRGQGMEANRRSARLPLRRFSRLLRPFRDDPPEPAPAQGLESRNTGQCHEPALMDFRVRGQGPRTRNDGLSAYYSKFRSSASSSALASFITDVPKPR
jgi:hypothetical protein